MAMTVNLAREQDKILTDKVRVRADTDIDHANLVSFYDEPIMRKTKRLTPRPDALDLHSSILQAIGKFDA